MANHWNQLSIPHKGWSLVNVVDIREDGQTESETDYGTCMMCGNEKIRYVHILSHPEVQDDYRVGCVCAEKMTSDYFNPKQREKELRNKANRRINWSKKQWKTNPKGNHYFKFNDRFLLIYRDPKTTKFKIKIGDVFGHKTFDSLEKAKIAVFNGIEYLKNKGTW